MTVGGRFLQGKKKTPSHRAGPCPQISSTFNSAWPTWTGAGLAVHALFTHRPDVLYGRNCNLSTSWPRRGMTPPSAALTYPDRFVVAGDSSDARSLTAPIDELITREQLPCVSAFTCEPMSTLDLDDPSLSLFSARSKCSLAGFLASLAPSRSIKRFAAIFLSNLVAFHLDSNGLPLATDFRRGNGPHPMLQYHNPARLAA